MRGGTKEGDKVLGEWPFASVRGGRDERRQHKDWTERGRGQVRFTGGAKAWLGNNN